MAELLRENGEWNSEKINDVLLPVEREVVWNR